MRYLKEILTKKIKEIYSIYLKNRLILRKIILEKIKKLMFKKYNLKILKLKKIIKNSKRFRIYFKEKNPVLNFRTS